MKRMLSVFCIGALVMVTACANLQTNEQQGTAAGVGIGAATGAILGQAIGRNTQGTLLGAAAGALIGGIAGNRIGAYMDNQQRQLQAVAAQSQAMAVSRSQDVLTATFKSDVLFDFNSAALKPGAWPEIDRVAKVLMDYPQTMVRVEGYTDSKGSEVYNQKLSERRAETVKNALIQKGIDPGRITAIGYGKTMPISSDDALNRRVNIVITPIQAQG